MGNDGGSIPTRRELVKEGAREKTTSEVWEASQQNNSYHWTYCPLSKRPLASPVVSDSIGRLFNKDSVLEWLLGPEAAFGDGAQVLKVGGVAGLKDVVDVKFEVADAASSAAAAQPERNGNSNGNGHGVTTTGADARTETWVCPVSRKELGPGSRAVYLVPCGHAFAQAVISEIKGDECLVCSKPFEASNVIPINPTQKADVDRLKARMEKLSAEGLSHSLKKSSTTKKRKKDKEKRDKHAGENGIKEPPSSSSNGATASASASAAAAASAAAGETKPTAKPSIANAATASITSKVLAEQESSKRRKVESNNVKSLYTSSTVSKDANGAKPSANRDFMSRGFSIPSKSSN